MGAKIKILFFASNPDYSASLKLDEEIRLIATKIRLSNYPDVLDLVSCWAVRPDDLLQELNVHKPTIVHFCGHGSRVGEIILMDDNRKPKAVSASALKALFTTLKDNIRLVILNACYSEVQATAISEIVDCVIGMNTTIGDKAAITFAASFYRAIGFSRSVLEAFEQGKVALMLEGIPEENTPVLLTRQGIDPTKIHLMRTAEVEDNSGTGINSYCSCLTQYLESWRGLGLFSNKNLKLIYVPHVLFDKSQKSKEVSDPSVLDSLLKRKADRPSVLIEGNAGSGKTTLLRNWAMTLSQSRLQSNPRGYIPIYLPLGWLERFCGKGPWTKSLVELAAQRCPEVIGRASESLMMGLTEALQRNRVVILLDAVDEISKPALPHFLDWWNRIRVSSMHCPIVLSSRPYIHTDGMIVSNKLYVRAFNTQQRQTFIENWFGGNEQAIIALRRHLQQSLKLQVPDVAGNPLFLTMMCIEFEKRGKLSTTPGKLLDQFVRLLLGAWDMERGVQRTSIPLDLKLRVLESVASHYFQLNRGNFSERELLDHTHKFLSQFGSSFHSSDVIEEIVTTSGLLVKDSLGGDYQFCHDLFIEYFMARDKSFGLNENEQERWLQEVFFDSRYEKVIQFYQELKFGV